MAFVCQLGGHGPFVIPNFVNDVLITVAVCWWRWRKP